MIPRIALVSTLVCLAAAAAFAETRSSTVTGPNGAVVTGGGDCSRLTTGGVSCAGARVYTGPNGAGATRDRAGVTTAEGFERTRTRTGPQGRSASVTRVFRR